jgi:hypothetical protein
MTDKDMFKSVAYDSLEKQVDGSHYKGMKIQPAQFINENKLLFAEGCAIKYICRHHKKGKEKDIDIIPISLISFYHPYIFQF